jgi:hypothetical protein
MKRSSRQPNITRKSSLRLNYGIGGSYIVHRMPVYVSVASSYCKVGELAGTRWKCTERTGSQENSREPTIEGPRRGWNGRETQRKSRKCKEVSSCHRK